MEKKFKCESCGCVFDADINHYVTCPQCQSDNVSLVKGSSIAPKILIGLGAVVLLAGVGYAAYYFMNREPENDVYETHESVAVIHQEEPVFDDADAESIAQIEKDLPHDLVWLNPGTTPVYDKASNSYSVTVKAYVQGAEASDFKLTYEATQVGSDKVVATSETGAFTGLAPIAASKNNPESTYTIRAIAKRSQEPVDTAYTNVSGFVVFVQPVSQMSVAEMQKIIDNKTSVSALSSNPQLAKSVKVQCKGSMGDEAVPTSLDRLIKQIKMDNSLVGARVISLGYDDSNKVNLVVFEPVLAN